MLMTGFLPSVKREEARGSSQNHRASRLINVLVLDEVLSSAVALSISRMEMRELDVRGGSRASHMAFCGRQAS